MSRLKLFVSHSSRLDDVDDDGLPLQHNWDLLTKTCTAIKDKYQDRVEVLVDYAGLAPGDNWNHKLNLWLAECQAAIILFSRRALKKSRWVEKEATILSWRAELDANFKLIPVTLKGQTSPEDLEQELLGVLKININQCIRDAENANDILAGIVAQLGEPQDLASDYPATPLERLQGGVVKFLLEEVTLGSMDEALQAVGDMSPPAGNAITADHYARLLSRRFFIADEQGGACFSRFQKAWDPLSPRPVYERAREFFAYIRSFWVEPGAAGSVLYAVNHDVPMALNGLYVSLADPELESECYTLDRYLERARPGWNLRLPVSVAVTLPAEDIKAEVRRRFFGAAPLPPGMNPAQLDLAINNDPKTIVLILKCGADQGGLIDPRYLRDDLAAVRECYQKLVVIIDLGGVSLPELPDAIKAVRPPLDPACETAAYLGERSARNYLNQIYGIGQ